MHFSGFSYLVSGREGAFLNLPTIDVLLSRGFNSEVFPFLWVLRIGGVCYCGTPCAFHILPLKYFGSGFTGLLSLHDVLDSLIYLISESDILRKHRH